MQVLNVALTLVMTTLMASRAHASFYAGALNFDCSPDSALGGKYLLKEIDRPILTPLNRGL
jgi:hypothetical protein